MYPKQTKQLMMLLYDSKTELKENIYKGYSIEQYSSLLMPWPLYKPL